MKKILSITLAVVLLAFSWVNAFAQDQRVFDNAALFSTAEIAQLEEEIAAARAATKMDMVVVTTDSTGGKTSRDYADNFYDENGFGVGTQCSGVLFLIDMDNRELTISTCGAMIDFLTDQRIENILDGAYDKASEGEYAAAASAFVSGVTGWVEKGVPGGQYQYDEDTGKVTRYHSLTLAEGLIAAGITLAVVAVIWIAVNQKYKLKTKEYEYPYRNLCAVNLRVKEDRFLHATTTQRRIQTSSGSSGGRGGGGSSSGRSSTHGSSSGRSHGGGSRKF